MATNLAVGQRLRPLLVASLPSAELSGPAQEVGPKTWRVALAPDLQPLEVKSLPSQGAGLNGLWGAAPRLARFLATPAWRHRLQGAVVIELGAGSCGAPGLASGVLGAACVVLSDVPWGPTLSLLERNAASTRLRFPDLCPIRVLPCIWGHHCPVCGAALHDGSSATRASPSDTAPQPAAERCGICDEANSARGAYDAGVCSDASGAGGDDGASGAGGSGVVLEFGSASCVGRGRPPVVVLGADIVYQTWQHEALLRALCCARPLCLPTRARSREPAEGAQGNGGGYVEIEQQDAHGWPAHEALPFVALLALADRGGGALEAFLALAQGSFGLVARCLEQPRRGRPRLQRRLPACRARVGERAGAPTLV